QARYDLRQRQGRCDRRQGAAFPPRKFLLGHPQFTLARVMERECEKLSSWGATLRMTVHSRLHKASKATFTRLCSAAGIGSTGRGGADAPKPRLSARAYMTRKLP